MMNEEKLKQFRDLLPLEKRQKLARTIKVFSKSVAVVLEEEGPKSFFTVIQDQLVERTNGRDSNNVGIELFQMIHTLTMLHLLSKLKEEDSEIWKRKILESLEESTEHVINIFTEETLNERA